jgi:hypothetical protein
MEQRQAMVSRSLRLHRDTLVVLKEQADSQGLGITVYIRKVLESLVENIQTKVEPVHFSSMEDGLRYPEL